jgi:hypothetical protein
MENQNMGERNGIFPMVFGLSEMRVRNGIDLMDVHLMFDSDLENIPSSIHEFHE